MSEELGLWQEIEILPDLDVIDELLSDLLPGQDTSAMDFIGGVLKGNWVLEPSLFWKYITLSALFPSEAFYF